MECKNISDKMKMGTALNETDIEYLDCVKLTERMHSTIESTSLDPNRIHQSA